MNRIIGNAGLALCVLVTATLLGCEKPAGQESRMDTMKNTAKEMKSDASDVADKAKDVADKAKVSAGQMKDSAGEMKDDAGQYFDDATITAKVKEKLVAEPVTKAYQISVETLNGTVQLSGFVQSSAEMNKAEEIAAAVSGVKSVKNDLILKSKTESRNSSGKTKFA